MKYFFNYIFYFTWKALACGDGFLYKIGASIAYFFRPSTKKYKHLAKKSYEMTVKNPSIGVNIIFAHKIMLSTTSIIVLNFIIFVVYTFDFSLVDFIEPWFGKMDRSYNVWSSIAIMLFFSISINEKLLEWHTDGYVQHFNKFKSIENKTKGYFITCLFHFLPVLLLIFLIFYFELYQR